MIERICGECGNRFFNLNGWRCQPCRYKRFLAMTEINATAHKLVAREIRLGRLPSLHANVIPCVDCGGRAKDYDHRDYSKPMEVEPVCRRCNLRRGPAKQTAEFIARNPSRPKSIRVAGAA